MSILWKDKKYINNLIKILVNVFERDVINLERRIRLNNWKHDWVYTIIFANSLIIGKSK